jgi:hypothetical protein
MNDIFKLGEFFFSYFMGRKNLISEKSLEISAEILNQLRRILILTVLTFGGLVLFCMGMSYMIERLLDNLDKGVFILSPSIWFIFFFQLVCIGIILFATNKKRWLDIFKSGKKEASSSEHAVTPAAGHGQLESVISLLIMDIIRDREFKREQQTAKPKPE